MSATLTWICDVCGTVLARDVSDEAACDFKVRVRYPEGWYIGQEKTACALTACQAAVMAHDHYLEDTKAQQEEGFDTVDGFNPISGEEI